MPRRWKFTLTFCLSAFLLFPCAYAGEGTAYTYTISVNGDWIRTQDAYLPGRILFQDGSLNKPYDICIRDGAMYVADSGDGCVVRYDMATGESVRFGEDILEGPRGLFVSADGRCYVADYDAERVVVFSSDGQAEMIIDRPESYLFSEQSRYKPTGVAVASSGIIYVVGEGSYEGIMQFSKNGGFQGYYAANMADISLLQRIQELIFSEQQLGRLLNRTPRAIHAIDIDESDLVFSVTQDAAVSFEWRDAVTSGDDNVKRHNFAGENILRKEGGMAQEWNFHDIAVSPGGGCYVLTSTGLINEYDSSANLLFSFGGRAVSSERSGLFTSAAAIDTDENGILYVLDMERGHVQTFYPTEFANATHAAISELLAGNYGQSEQLWTELLRLNGLSYLAHYGYAKCLFAQQRFSEALEQYRIARDITGYSESFWELRDAWLNRWIGVLLMAVVAAALLLWLWRKLAACSRLRRERKPLTGWQKDTLLLKEMLRHPLDSFYYIKRGEKGSVAFASGLYVAALAVWFWDRLFRGFAFNHTNIRYEQPLTVALLFLLPIGLWVTGNYFVASINDGEGKFRAVYVGTAYALAPYILLMPIPLLLSYVLTLNESFIIQFSTAFLLAWSGVLIFAGVSEIHNYRFKGTVKNILLTVFFMVMVVVIFVVLYLIWQQVIEFLGSVGGEVTYRVTA
ncbi:MAG: YIP1 family protein [Oscillospiraceae bacterium]|jgi:sugar lactone lactonase YvrE|nr:YIP1 family protein [Oscillospiraceae bacterium]